jgi:hypothetical protein
MWKISYPFHSPLRRKRPITFYVVYASAPLTTTVGKMIVAGVPLAAAPRAPTGSGAPNIRQITELDLLRRFT